MAAIEIPASARGRMFQVWDYTPSRRTLLARSPGGSSADDNIDIHFIGVSRVDLATKFEVEEVHRFRDDSVGGLTLFKFLLVGPDGSGSVVAEDMKFDENSKPLFEGLSDASASTFEDGARLELSVLTALKTNFPEAIIATNQPRRPDIEVTIGERRAFVEVVRSNEDPVDRQVRRLVMDRVPNWDAIAVRDVPLIVVIGGLRPEQLVGPLSAHLTTGLSHAKVDAFTWDEEGERTLRRRLQPLIRPQTLGSSGFRVYQDQTGKFRWRLQAANGEIIAVGDSYETHESALRAVAAVKRVAQTSTPAD